MHDTVYAQAPHFSRFPDMARKERLSFHSLNVPEDGVTSGMEIITSPNNPDGKRTKNYTHCPGLYDLCYNWTQYGNVVKADEDIMVFSLSKATGHAGSRIGWGIFADKQVAQEVQEFIEIDSCGVSSDAQTKALSMILNQLSRPKSKRCFYFGRYELKYRWAKLKQAAALHDTFTLTNRLGMFALIKMSDDVPEQAEHFFKAKFGVQGTSGEHFGLDSDYVRLNIGCDTAEFDDFIRRLEENS